MHNLVGDSFLNMWISFSVTDTKALKAGGAMLGGSVKEPVEKSQPSREASLIFLFNWRKKKHVCKAFI